MFTFVVNLARYISADQITINKKEK